MKLFLVLLISIILFFLQPFEGLGDSAPRSNDAAATLSSPTLVGNQNSSDVISIDKKHNHHHHPAKKVMINCGLECKRRCKETSRKKVCHRACKACCQKCHCVPPGTYGHKHVCPCYAKLKTHGGKPKCP
ncbi:unnamed protein product [Linum tenue]|uniref:Uncharacterized protein n=1 Tax=Linum tenue TaxID=586396 RepID=A0AAV0IFV9_9ROSI|nr:unnamed protein product [Linum tenue]